MALHNLKKTSILAVAFGGMMVLSQAAMAQKAPALINAPTYNLTSGLLTFGEDTGVQVTVSIPLSNYLPVSNPTFTGTLTGPTLALTGSVPMGSVLAAPSGAAGAPVFRTLVAGDTPFDAPLASPVFTGTVSIPTLNITVGASFAGPIALSATPSVTPATITAPSAGSAPTGATSLALDVTLVTTCSATQPLQLPAGAASGLSSSRKVMYYPSAGTTTPCVIYPPAGGTLSNAGTNVAATMAPFTSMVFSSISASAWYQ